MKQSNSRSLCSLPACLTARNASSSLVCVVEVGGHQQVQYSISQELQPLVPLDTAQARNADLSMLGTRYRRMHAVWGISANPGALGTAGRSTVLASRAIRELHEWRVAAQAGSRPAQPDRATWRSSCGTDSAASRPCHAFLAPLQAVFSWTADYLVHRAYPCSRMCYISPVAERCRTACSWDAADTLQRHEDRACLP